MMVSCSARPAVERHSGLTRELSPSLRIQVSTLDWESFQTMKVIQQFGLI